MTQSIPNLATVGDSFNALVTAPDHRPTDGWALKLRMVPRAAGNVIALTAAAEADAHRFTATASASAAWAAGAYGWAMWAERGAESTTLATGQIQLQPNPRTLAAGADTRSTARKALEDLKAAVAAWNPMRKAYTIAGRSMEFNSVAEILKLINHFESQVAAEDQLAGRAEKLGRRIFTRI